MDPVTGMKYRYSERESSGVAKFSARKPSFGNFDSIAAGGLAYVHAFVRPCNERIEIVAFPYHGSPDRSGNRYSTAVL
jgi:hypothetical protein